MTEKVSWHKTHCARMDHGGCSIQVGVRNNQIVKVKGDPDGFLNQGYICPKGTASPQRLTHPLRLRQPLIRKGSRGEGKWQTIPWDEAIAYIADKLQGVKDRIGAKGVAFCQGMPKGLEHFVLIRLVLLLAAVLLLA